MIQRLLGLLALISTSVAPTFAINREILSGSDASILGLEQSWQRAVRAGAGLSNLSDIVLHVSGKNAHKLIEIHDGDKVVWRMPTERLNPATGRSLGEKRVMELANRELIGLKSLGVKGEIKEQTIPQIFLYALGRDGTVQAIDAETGETKWLNRYGKPYQPKFSLGVSDEFVVFVSGSTLFQLSAEDGNLIASRDLNTVPVVGPVVAGDYMLVSTTSGGLEGNFLNDISEAPYLSQTAGQALAKARMFPKSDKIAWPTSKGYVYCMELGGTPSQLFRLRPPGLVTGRIETVGADMMYFCTESGHIYGCKATRKGQLQWGVSTGEALYGDTISFGQHVYATSGRGNLYAVKLENGSLAWKAPASKIDHVLGAIGDRVFAQDQSKQLVALSEKTGARMGTARGTRVHRAIVNRSTDRLYLVTSSGNVQCLRPIGKELPELKVPVEYKQPTSEKMAPKAKTPAANASPFEPGGEVDPFGANPFDAPGGGGGDAAMEPDPFGGDAAAPDPFGDSPF